MDADAEGSALVWCCVDIAVARAPLHLDGAPHRLGRASELDEQTVAGRSYNATVIFRNLSICEIMAICLQPFEGAFLVCFDQA